MELSINISNLMNRYDFGTCIDIYKTAGFTAADYSLCGMTSDASPFCMEGYRSLAEEIRRISDEKGFPITQTHTPFQFNKLWDDPVYFEETIMPRMIRSIEISGILGAKVAVVHPIHHMVYRGHEEEIFELNMRYYNRLLPYCKEYGVMCGVENMHQPDVLRKRRDHDTCSRAEEFIRYIDTLDSEYMIACLDVGHVELPETDETVASMIRALGHDRLKALHIHDNDYTNDHHLLPYRGRLNWMEIARALGEIDYTGDFTYEVKGSTVFGACEDSAVPMLARHMADVGKHITSEIDRCRPKV